MEITADERKNGWTSETLREYIREREQVPNIPQRARPVEQEKVRFYRWRSR